MVAQLQEQTNLLRTVTLRTFITRALLLCALWWLLTGSSGSKAWVIGWPVIALALLASLRLSNPRRISPAGLILFCGFFLRQSLKAGLQVTAMALRPQLNLQPAMLDIDLRLRRQAEQVFLAGTLSLLPGTLSTGLEGWRLRLHVLDARLSAEEEVRAVEVRVARLFGTELQ